MKASPTIQAKRRHRAATSFTLIALSCLIACAVVGCSAQSGTSSGSSSSGSSAQTKKVVIGTLATEDILPMWVAKDQNLFAEEGIEGDVQVFQSATELISAVSSGSVDFAMTDPMVAASLCAGATDVRAEWVTLGTDASQGRFGIMTSADSGITSLSQLADTPIGVGSNTILEYVMDKLMEQAGIPDDQIKTEELQKLPVRYQAMTSHQVAAAALPASLLALGESSGCVLLADDTQGDNISQSIMIVRSDFLKKDGGQSTLESLERVWNTAVDKINANPESYRDLLAANANLSENVAATYKISKYPHAQMPTSEMINPVLDWMSKKGYLQTPLTYDEQTGAFTTA